MRVALAASKGFAELDASWALLRDAFAGEGVDAEVAWWDVPGADWGRFDAVLPLYVWGYPTRHAEFLAWVADVAGRTTLINTPRALVWNSDKRYLAELGAAGVPVVPTAWVGPGDRWREPSDDYVVKPTVASGGLGAARYRASERRAAERHVRRLHAEGATVMVQPYQADVDGGGEVGLVYVEGRCTHAVRKGPLLVPGAGEVDRLWEQERISPVEPRPDQEAAATAALDAVGRLVGPAVYARVDVVDGAAGQPVVLEVELIEPALHFLHAPLAAVTLAQAVRRSLGVP